MAPDNVYITIIRTGKDEVTVTLPAGATVREAFEKADIAPAVYNAWSITDEDGNSMSLSSTLSSSTALVCGARTNGAA